MAIYRSDQATVTFAPEVGQGGYMEAGDSASFANVGTLGISTAVKPGDRTITLTGAFSPSSGANLKTFIIVGNETYLAGPREMRRVVAGFGTTVESDGIPKFNIFNPLDARLCPHFVSISLHSASLLHKSFEKLLAKVLKHSVFKSAKDVSLNDSRNLEITSDKRALCFSL